MLKVSIIVPVYNSQSYLEKCIDSILNQTYGNIEVLLINDGSTDDSGKICDEFAEKDARVKVFHIENGGPSKARNFGIENSNGDIISFVDSDDYIDENMAQKMIESLGTSDLIMCNYLSCDKDNENYFEHNLGNREFNKNEIIDVFCPAFFYSKINGLGSCCNKYYVKQFLIDNNIRFNENLIRAEDFWFNFDCFTSAKSIKSINDYLYYYMQVNDNSTMHQVRETQYEDWKFTRKRLLQKYNELNLKFKLDYDEFYKNFLNNVSVYLVQRLRRNVKDKKVLHIINDDFYKSALRYRNNLSTHIKFLAYLTLKSTKMAYLFYILWATVFKF